LGLGEAFFAAATPRRRRRSKLAPPCMGRLIGLKKAHFAFRRIVVPYVLFARVVARIRSTELSPLPDKASCAGRHRFAPASPGSSVCKQQSGSGSIPLDLQRSRGCGAGFAGPSGCIESPHPQKRGKNRAENKHRGLSLRERPRQVRNWSGLLFGGD
jgi:hypothetical protein